MKLSGGNGRAEKCFSYVRDVTARDINYFYIICFKERSEKTVWGMKKEVSNCFCFKGRSRKAVWGMKKEISNCVYFKERSRKAVWKMKNTISNCFFF